MEDTGNSATRPYLPPTTLAQKNGGSWRAREAQRWCRETEGGNTGYTQQPASAFSSLAFVPSGHPPDTELTNFATKHIRKSSKRKREVEQEMEAATKAMAAAPALHAAAERALQLRLRLHYLNADFRVRVLTHSKPWLQPGRLVAVPKENVRGKAAELCDDDACDSFSERQVAAKGLVWCVLLASKFQVEKGGADGGTERGETSAARDGGSGG
eukprot:4563223-Pleurochrysis_carterae.AAC.1